MLFVQMGRLEEAANSFEWVMREQPEFTAGLHAVLCHFALSHRDKMKRSFLELLEVQLNIDQEDKYNTSAVSLYSICSHLIPVCCQYCSPYTIINILSNHDFCLPFYVSFYEVFMN